MPTSAKALLLHNLPASLATLIGWSYQSVAAAGSSITDATDITERLAAVTGGDATKGVQLPLGIEPGEVIFVQNNAAATLKVYPASASHTFNGGSGGAAITLSAYAAALIIRISVTDSITFEIQRGAQFYSGLTVTGGATIDSVSIGGASNKITIDSSGELTLAGTATRFDDLPPVPLLISRVGANAPTLAQFKTNVYQYTFDATNDEVFGATELTHKYKEGSTIEAHVHWATNGSEGSDKAVKWQLEYTIANGSAAGSAAFGAEVPLSEETPIPANTPDRSHFITDLGDIAGTNIEIGAYICWRLTRIAAAGTAPAADPFGLAVGFHVEMDTMGSKTMYDK